LQFGTLCAEAFPRMTSPRQVLPGATYLITRRCSERRFFLRPSRISNAIFVFVLAIAAQRFGIRVHAFCVLSNHFHLVVTDPDARLPAFVQYLCSLVARATNAFLGRWEAFWAQGSYSAVRLESPEDIVAKSAYTLANPVAAHLVRRGIEWPGPHTTAEQIGGVPLRAERPKTFFRSKGYLPEAAELKLSVPPGFASAAEFREQLSAALLALEQETVASEGPTVLGVAKVLAQKPWARPAPGAPRRVLNPRVAARDKWQRIEALSRLKDFLSAYREAWNRRRRGAQGVVFPAGTYLLRVLHRVECAAIA
jgi:putative transposase